MNAARRNNRTTAFKGVLILIGLALLIVQLSDKFYRFANQPFLDLSVKTTAHKSFLSAKPGLSKECCFTPDRRYQTESGFALVSLPFEPILWPVSRGRDFCILNETTTRSNFPLTSLRGPPGA
ncbi:MAG TPA: hypothetical protein VI233_12390 [Puia sp.]